MIIHSKDHVSKLDDKCIQPNAVDIRCAELFRIAADDMRIVVSEGKKEFFPQRPVQAQSVLGAGSPMMAWRLDPRTSYQFETEHQVEVPHGTCGWLIGRSTLCRNGIILTAGLYDAGYNGMIGGQIHNMTEGAVLLEVNCRIGQFIMSSSETNHMYDGHYNNNGGRSV